MDPATIALLAPIAEKIVITGGGALLAWIFHRSHSATVQAVAQAGVQTAQVAATAAVQGAATALAQGASPKDAAKAAGAAAAGAAVAALPQVTVKDPTQVDDGK